MMQTAYRYAYYSLTIITLTVLVSSSIYSMYIPSLHNVFFKPHYHPKSRLQTSFLALTGVSTRAFNACDNCDNVLRIWTEDQNAIAMLKGCDQKQAIADIANAIGLANANGKGHFLANGNLDLKFSGSFAARYFFNHDLSLAFYLPIHKVALCNVRWCDQTPIEEMQTRTLLTDNIFCQTRTLGDGLDLAGWQRSGVGDLIAQIEWERDFPQAKPFLKNVHLAWRFGLSLPTGLEEDVDKIIAFGFGNTGATSLVFGGGLGLRFGDYINAGFDVELVHRFGNSRIKRIKTDIDQTDLLLLKKTCTYTDWGLIQQFNLFLDIVNFYKGLFLKVDYQFLKHGDNFVATNDATVSSRIANTAVHLEERTAHTGIFKLGYDFDCHLNDTAPAIPQVALFATVPFNGKRSIQWVTVGGMISCEF